MEPVICIKAIVGRVRTSPFALRILRGSLWSFVGSLTSRILSLAAAMLTARILGKAAFGELGIVQSTVGMFAMFAGFGMGTTAAKYIAQYLAEDVARAASVVRVVLITSVVTTLVFCVVLYLASPSIAAHFFSSTTLEHPLRVSCVLLFFTAVNGAEFGVLSGFEAFHWIAASSGASGIVAFPLVICGARLGGVDGVVIGMGLAQAVGFAVATYGCNKQIVRNNLPRASACWRRELPILWQFSLPAVMGSVVMGPVGWMCTALLVHQPNGLLEMGAFNAANQWLGTMLWLPYVFAQTILPMMSERVAARDATRCFKLMRAAVYVNALCSVPIVIVGSSLSAMIMRGYGKSFASDWSVLVVVLVTGMVAAGQIPFGNVLAATGKMWLGLCVNLIWAAVFVGSTYPLIHFGANGLAFARLIAYACQGFAGCILAIAALRAVNPQVKELAQVGQSLVGAKYPVPCREGQRQLTSVTR